MEKDHGVEEGYLSDSHSHSNGSSDLKTAKDGRTVLVPQPTDDPNDPLNWRPRMKWLMLFLISMISFLSDFGTTTGIPAFLPQAKEWRIPEATVQHSLVGMLFCLGAGGLFVVVLAAFVGRLPVLVSFQVMTTATGIWCAKVVSFDEYMAARIVNGFFGSLAQAGGLMWIQDMFFFHEHPRKINIWIASNIAAPYIGPLVGSFVDWKLDWRWSFWIYSILAALTLLITLLFADESYYNRKCPTNLQPARRSRLLRLTGYEQRASGLITGGLLRACARPARTVVKIPVVLGMVFSFLTFAWVIGVNATVGIQLAESYHFGPKSLGLFYLAGVVGCLIGWLLGHTLHPPIGALYTRRSPAATTLPPPEARLNLIYPAEALMFAALIVLGFALQQHMHYMVVAVFYGAHVCGVVVATGSISAYLLDAYPEASGEVGAWLNFGRLTGGFMATYVQMEWVARDGPARAFGGEAAIVGVAGLLVAGLQVGGAGLRGLQGPVGGT